MSHPRLQNTPDSKCSKPTEFLCFCLYVLKTPTRILVLFTSQDHEFEVMEVPFRWSPGQSTTGAALLTTVKVRFEFPGSGCQENSRSVPVILHLGRVGWTLWFLIYPLSMVTKSTVSFSFKTYIIYSHERQFRKDTDINSDLSGSYQNFVQNT